MSDEHGIPECTKCHNFVRTGDGLEPTDLCNLCAQEEAVSQRQRAEAAEAERDRLASDRPLLVKQVVDLTAERDALLKEVSTPDDFTALAEIQERTAAERDALKDCGQSVVCARPPGCARHWEERNRELVAERDALREALEKLLVYVEYPAHKIYPRMDSPNTGAASAARALLSAAPADNPKKERGFAEGPKSPTTAWPLTRSPKGDKP